MVVGVVVDGAVVVGVVADVAAAEDLPSSELLPSSLPSSELPPSSSPEAAPSLEVAVDEPPVAVVPDPLAVVLDPLAMVLEVVVPGMAWETATPSPMATATAPPATSRPSARERASPPRPEIALPDPAPPGWRTRGERGASRALDAGVARSDGRVARSDGAVQGAPRGAVSVMESMEAAGISSPP
ncbi:MAG: hypothetical protein ACRDYZ_12785, partial [Acidimicrobiales bacterium]